jgi:hypothetical protein
MAPPTLQALGFASFAWIKELLCRTSSLLLRRFLADEREIAQKQGFLI